ncbi:MAG: DUF523 domain-containing protein [Ruminiclostridium sp.]|nr:DUF523 domain-containing protein [Ruminiclostridium sp.]
MILVSACLAGINCKYDGRNNYVEEFKKMVANGSAIPVCPEQLGGCPTPRPAVEIHGGTGADVLDGKCAVLRKNGEDATDELVKGAEETLKIAQTAGIERAVLKAGSPSCGCGTIYDGSFSGKLKKGNGVTAELLLRNGIRVTTEED